MKRNESTTSDITTEILAAMVRVLSGHPTIATPGDLTITGVAAEAQVKRHLLTHKHTELKDLFYRLRDTRNNPVLAQIEKSTAKHAELNAKLTQARQDAQKWKATAHTFARAIHVLKIDNENLKREASPKPLRSIR